jgi:hypothetical protein
MDQIGRVEKLHVRGFGIADDRVDGRFTRHVPKAGDLANSRHLVTLMDQRIHHGIGKVAVWVPVVALPAECLIRRDGLWFGLGFRVTKPASVMNLVAGDDNEVVHDRRNRGIVAFLRDSARARG